MGADGGGTETGRPGPSATRTSRIELLVRRFVLLAPPVVLAAVTFRHPGEDGDGGFAADIAPVAGEWVGAHVLLVTFSALLAVGLYSLVADRRGPVALLARVATACYAFAATVWYSVNGLAVGIALAAVKEEPDIDPSALEPVVGRLLTGQVGTLFPLFGVVAYVVAVVATAVVLRRAGAPRPPLLGLVGSSAAILLHKGPPAVVGMALYFGAVAWLEFAWDGGRSVASAERDG